MARISCAVIGLGWVATHRHIPLILRHPRLHLYGIVDKRPERLERFSARYPGLQTSLSSEGEMPWADNVQAVLIATDPIHHYPLAKKMLLMGKHVLMEKPLTMTPDEAQELVALASNQGVICCVVHNFQFASSALRLQRMIHSGRLGDLQSVEAMQLSNPRRRLPSWYEQLPWGLFYDESPHMFYMLEALAGQPLELLSAMALKRPGRNTPALVSAHYTCGMLPLRLTMNFESALSEWHIAVLGSKRIGIVDLFRDILVTLPNDGPHRARQILLSSLSAGTTHIFGFLKSGVALLGGKLYYGTDKIWERFLAAIEGQPIETHLTAEGGSHIVQLQHQLMRRSQVWTLPST